MLTAQPRSARAHLSRGASKRQFDGAEASAASQESHAVRPGERRDRTRRHVHDLRREPAGEHAHPRVVRDDEHAVRRRARPRPPRSSRGRRRRAARPARRRRSSTSAKISAVVSARSAVLERIASGRTPVPASRFAMRGASCSPRSFSGRSWSSRSGSSQLDLAWRASTRVFTIAKIRPPAAPARTTRRDAPYAHPGRRPWHPPRRCRPTRDGHRMPRRARARAAPRRRARRGCSRGSRGPPNGRRRRRRCRDGCLRRPAPATSSASAITSAAPRRRTSSSPMTVMP